MTRSVRKRSLVALGVAAAALWGCGHSAPTRLYTLSPSAPATDVGRNYTGPVLEVGAVRAPPALDRAELVTEVAPDQLQVREFERWAAPLSRLARAALTQNLTLRLPPGRVALPDAPPDPEARRLSVVLLSFTVREGGASLSAGWSLSCANASGAPRSSRAELQAPTVMPVSVARAMDDLLGLLADRIAADVAADPPSACLSSPFPRRLDRKP